MIALVTPLIRACEKLGDGLTPEYLECIKRNIKTPQIVENLVSENDYSYFPVGRKQGTRIFRLSHGNNGRIYIEMNHVNLDSKFSSLWKLTDMECEKYHARGVAYCYYGDDIETAIELIQEVKQNHRVLKQLNATHKKKKQLEWDYSKDPFYSEKVQIWTYKLTPSRPYQYKLAVKAFGNVYDDFHLFTQMEGDNGAREAARKFIIGSLHEVLTQSEKKHLDEIKQFRILSCDDYRKSGPRCQTSWYDK